MARDSAAKMPRMIVRRCSGISQIHYKFSAEVKYQSLRVGSRLDASAIDVRVGYAHGSWTTSLWVRNLFDARYAQQGFYFGLNPPNFPNQSFLQQGDPRQVGITLNYR